MTGKDMVCILPSVLECKDCWSGRTCRLKRPNEHAEVSCKYLLIIEHREESCEEGV